MKLMSKTVERQTGADHALVRWTAVQRERLLEDRLDALTATLERLVAVLERSDHE